MFLEEAKNEMAYLKAGIMGFAGAGKTFTATDIAIGLAKMTGAKQVAFLDSETGSDFMIKKFEKNGIKLLRKKSRSYADLVTFLKECEKNKITIAIIDSITHFWTELQDSYMRTNNRKRLTFPDWKYLKTTWGQFTDLYVNSPIHIIMCGRAGHEYEQSKDEDGKPEITKIGTKMKSESETSFEPSLLLEMERARIDEHTFVNRVHVLKDRWDVIDGKSFDRPTFNTFIPHINLLNIGGTHIGVDVTRTSDAIIENQNEYIQNKKTKEILIEELGEALTLAGLDGTKQEVKQMRMQTLLEIFGTSVKAKIEELNNEALAGGIEKIRAMKPAYQAALVNYADQVKMEN